MMYNHLPFGANRSRGFTLLVALILTSVILSVSLSLLNIAYKQVILSGTTAQSQIAFYAADSGLECALYWDQQKDEFDYNTEPVGTTQIASMCQGQTITFTASAPVGNVRTTTFNIPCAGQTDPNDTASITIIRKSTGSATIYSDGYNDCNPNDAKRIERGIDATY